MSRRFWRHRDGGPAETAGSAVGERVGLLSRFRSRKSEKLLRPPSADVSSAASSPRSSHLIPDGHSGDATRTPSRSIERSLWDRAYTELAKQCPELVEKYENLLVTESSSIGSIPDESLHAKIAARGAAPEVVVHFDRTRFYAIAEEGLAQMEDKRTKFRVGSLEVVPKEHITHAAELLLWAQDWIGGALKASPEASMAWAGICLVLPLLTNPTTADEANRDGFGYVMARMRYYTALESLVEDLGRSSNTTDALTQAYESIVLLYQGILDFQFRSVLRFYRNRFKRYAGDMFLSDDWSKKREGIEKLEAIVNENLRQINELVARQHLGSLNQTSTASLETLQGLLSLSKQQLEVTEQHRALAQEQLSLQQDGVKRHQSDKEEKCHQLFRLTSSKKDATYEWYKDRVENHVEGTCQWLLTHDNFQGWMAQESGMLLVSADPGCGKSVLAKHLIDVTLQPATICYFFFKDQDQNTVRQALCALLHQLFSQKPFLIKHAMNEYSKNGQGLVNITASLWNIFDSAVQDSQAGAIVVFLDALDECAESEFEDLVRHLKPRYLEDRSSSHKLKFLLTSRPYNQIVSEFRDLVDNIPRIHIPGEEHSDAISQEVNLVIENRAKSLGLSSDLTTHLTGKLLEIPHRTYLWVHLVFDDLEKDGFKKTPKGVELAIAKLPKSVNEAYNQILEKSKDPSTAKAALAIILAAQRPLTLSEMNVAVNMQSNHRKFSDLDLEADADFKSTLRSLCGLFVSIHHGKVYFLHQTAREFLLADPLSTEAQSTLNWHGSINMRQAHTVLAGKSIHYLALFNTSNYDPDIENRTFLDYSAGNWGVHFREATIADSNPLVSIALAIGDPDSVSYSLWFERYWSTKGPNYKAPSNFSNIFLSTFFGHVATLKMLIVTGKIEIDSRDQLYHRTPLSYAAERGHDAVVKLLLATGKVDINSKDRYGKTPLFRATQEGHKAIVELLLATEKVEVNSRDKNGITPLSWAARYGEEAVVKLLLATEKVKVNSRDNDGITPLSWAVRNRNEAVVKLLLAIEKVDVNSRDNDGITPLSWAARYGEEAVVKLLLASEKVVVDTPDKYGRTPEVRAAGSGYQDIVRLLRTASKQQCSPVRT
ncbi:hypothetical protein PFICI_09691 [Pestalotiopsis fici W106-1]|uniref:Uncharacterized protein n=1 Tax=Pestalotiopsis fici (strain W106-1 / CGMCC3.15140) TaxID=1229662 RepID=W3WUY7_PESFW|nr:uncharacterized protein PFICI_09691 [Pestalotiopsis fici W106-1]ETS77629.1 hypothetical protein PFICI_09691 [Pestalotiopsis fici W106-1]